jgi:hypothetical protein
MQPEIAFLDQLYAMPGRASAVAIAQLAACRKSWCVERDTLRCELPFPPFEVTKLC